MKFKLLPVILALLPFFTMAQFTIKGRVIDEQTAVPLQGAHISFNGRLVKTTSDEKGMFVIKNVKLGNHKLKVSYMGYKTWEASFGIESDRTMLISMESTSILAEETIISATRAGEKTPVAFQNLSGEEINRKNQGRDIPFLLEQIDRKSVV